MKKTYWWLGRSVNPLSIPIDVQANAPVDINIELLNKFSHIYSLKSIFYYAERKDSHNINFNCITRNIMAELTITNKNNNRKISLRDSSHAILHSISKIVERKMIDLRILYLWRTIFFEFYVIKNVEIFVSSFNWIGNVYPYKYEKIIKSLLDIYYDLKMK
jgi:hypothetical protein